ncbi:unnamed protein product [Prorocentrum cordatum]|uniref:Solute carrier family 40 protein n=1 Tax=Prorocentrum cordatum TaxID=2364126 RepID=A0ABN9Q9V2_9DINO|nr:unnamed protein product [Polarella glacialis]
MDLGGATVEDGAPRRGDRLAAARFNLRLIFYVWFWYRLIDSNSYGAFLDIYLSELTGGRAYFVGVVETVMSLTQVGLAFPLGYLSDKHPRSSVMRASVFLGILACICFFSAVLSDSKPGLVAAAVAYAAYKANYCGTMDMVMADCATPATAAPVAARKTQFGTLGASFGPLAQLALLAAGLGRGGSAEGAEPWSLPQLRGLILASWAAFPLIAPAQCVFRDMPLRPPAEGLRESPEGLGEPFTPTASEASSVESGPRRPPRPWWVVPALLEGFRLALVLCFGISVRYLALMFRRGTSASRPRRWPSFTSCPRCCRR